MEQRKKQKDNVFFGCGYEFLLIFNVVTQIVFMAYMGWLKYLWLLLIVDFASYLFIKKKKK